LKISRFFGIPEKTENNTGKNRITTSKNMVNLEAGDKFKATVLDIKRNQVTIRLSDGGTLTAKSLVIPDAHIGEEMEFVVQSNKDGQILINISEQPPEQQQQNLLLNLLSSANIAVTDESLAVLKALMQSGLPIDKNTIQTLLQQLKANPQTDLKSLIFMLKEDIAITPENIKNVHLAANHENSLKNQIDELSWKIAAIDEPEIQNKLLEIFLTENKNADSFKENIHLLNNYNEFQPPKNFTSEQTVNINNIFQLFKDNADFFKYTFERFNSTHDIKQTLSELIKEFPQYSTFIMPLVEDEALSDSLGLFFEKQIPLSEKENLNKRAAKLSSLIKKELFIDLDNPDTSQEFNSYYQKLNEKLTQALNTVQKGGSSSQELKETLNSLKDNINFMSQINNFQEFIQIPFTTGESENNCELYIFNDKKNKKISKDKASVLLALDLKMLGHFEAFIQKDYNNISCQFRTVNQDIQSLLKINMPALQTALKNSGYNLYHVAYKTISEHFNILNTDNDLGIKADSSINSQNNKRYSFDMRA